jgi:hypothetical protein
MESYCNHFNCEPVLADEYRHKNGEGTVQKIATRTLNKLMRAQRAVCFWQAKRKATRVATICWEARETNAVTSFLPAKILESETLMHAFLVLLLSDSGSALILTAERTVFCDCVADSAFSSFRYD